MGPRITGFLVGGFITATAAAALFNYDFLRKQEVTHQKWRDVALQADILVHRYSVIEQGLNVLREREVEAAATAAPPA